MRPVAGLPAARAVRLAFALRNPGPEYEHTRHNAGTWWLDRIVAGADGSYSERSKLHAQESAADGVRLARNNTYMNDSGRAVAAVAAYYGIAPQELLLAHDELDLECGKARLKFGGGTAGHNGLRAARESLGTGEFWRLRIGIGRPPPGHDSVGFVLGRPPVAERELIDAAIERAAAVWPQVAAGDMDAAMQALHTEEA